MAQTKEKVAEYKKRYREINKEKIAKRLSPRRQAEIVEFIVKI
jgi:hypothetical protein